MVLKMIFAFALLSQPSTMRQVYSIKQFCTQNANLLCDVANQNIGVSFWTNQISRWHASTQLVEVVLSIHRCTSAWLRQCKHYICLQFISSLLSVAINSMPLLTHFLTRERWLWVRTPDSQVVPNKLVDFFFYVPNAAKTQSTKSAVHFFFRDLILHIKMCLCEGVTKTAASVDQPALFMWDFNQYTYMSMKAF